MAKVIVTCGKICSGKTTYANEICKRDKAVLLSIDEIMLALFGQHAGAKHDEYVQKIRQLLLSKSVELVACGVSVVLDWGLWSAAERGSLRAFYDSKGIDCEIHYIEIGDELWKQRITDRNRAVLEGRSDAYFIDDELAAKFSALFETPGEEEIDVWVTF